MLKISTILIFLLVSTALLANDSKESKPFFEKTIISAESLEIVTDNLKTNFQTEINKSEQVVSELPDAILRLYQLEKVEFTGLIIYTYKPLELANIKNPVKAA